MFGRNIGGELGVTEELVGLRGERDHARRASPSMTPWDNGATRRREVIKEPSKELQLIVPAEAEKDIKEKIDAIVAAYNSASSSRPSASSSGPLAPLSERPTNNLGYRRIAASLNRSFKLHSGKLG